MTKSARISIKDLADGKQVVIDGMSVQNAVPRITQSLTARNSG
jgi:hypothetical protein